MELLPARTPFALRLLLAVASGGIYALAYPPVGWRWLVLPGVLGLLIALQGQRGSKALAIGFLHGLAVFAVGLSWLYELFAVWAFFLWVVLAVFPSMFAHFQGLASQRGVKGWHFAAFTAANWGSWEYIRSELFWLKFPWLSVGSAIGPNGWLPWIGVYGVGALVVFGTALISLRHWKGGGASFALVLGACLVVSRHAEPRDDDPATVKLGGIQGEEGTLQDLLAATRTLLPEGLHYVVWPEYAVPYDIRANVKEWNLVQQLCRDRDITLTFGTQRHEAGGEVWRNIALTVDPSGARGEHNKVHPVHFFNDGVAGTTALPIETRHGKVGTPVCFDCDYEGVVRHMTAAGAEMFVVPVMDAKRWTARQHDQHAELMRIRACENGRWMFVCTTSGVSQVIDPSGMVHGRLGAMVEGVLTGSMRRESGLTFYTRLGWLTPWLVLGTAIASWILLLWPKRRDKAEEGVPA
ncbi:apolipoprotein N-acyltransferase [Luteolibacter soli]|uniref:Nitrilase-related carbon-nitrogen hydrolase n=1 Tax=Luteolibacter soli TaxID=3135280 RepID=A0ABU9ARS3_9BACT